MVSQGRRAANVGPVHGVCMYPIAPVASNWSRCLFRTGYQFVKILAVGNIYIMPYLILLCPYYAKY